MGAGVRSGGSFQYDGRIRLLATAGGVGVPASFAASSQLAKALASNGDSAARRSEQAADDEPGSNPDMLGGETLKRRGPPAPRVTTPPERFPSRARGRFRGRFSGSKGGRAR